MRSEPDRNDVCCVSHGYVWNLGVTGEAGKPPRIKITSSGDVTRRKVIQSAIEQKEPARTA